jgi:hypothetical protein
MVLANKPLQMALVEVVFAREGSGSQPLTPAEIASFEWVLENEAAISRALFASLAKDYPDHQEFYAYSAKRGPS